MLSSLANSTIKQYHDALKSWHLFCQEFKKDEFNPSIPDALHYLQEIKIKGASYGTLNTHRSALSLITKDKIEEDPLISRFMKGAFKENPTKPKYNATWDVSTVLHKLKTFSPLSDLSLQRLSEKLAMLLLLITGHRLQTITSICVDKLQETTEGFWAKIDKILKTTRPGSASTLLSFPKYPEAPELCAFSALKEYLLRTAELRGETKELFLTSTKPHKASTKDTVSRWIKNALKQSGIDTEIYSAHSTRHASTSMAMKKGLDIDIIRKTTGWSSSSQVFQRFYNVPIIAGDQRSFSQFILKN